MEYGPKEKDRFIPKGDKRLRTSVSVVLWVVTGKSMSGEEIFGIQTSIERVVYLIQGRSGKYVQYDNRFYPLHSEAEFKNYIDRAVKGDLYCYSNYSSAGTKKELKKIEPASFIFEHEAGLHI